MSARSVSGGPPRVSIAMPVYNGEQFIGRALESLLAQTYGDFELVIADNASTDATEEICRSWAARDQRIRYHRNERNLGGPGNFRRVFSLSRGELHKWSTADDYWAPTAVAECVAALDRDPGVVLAYPRTTLVDETEQATEQFDDPLHLDQESPADRFIMVLEISTLCHAHLGVIRRAVMEQTRLIGDELASDIRFLAELSLYGRFQVVPEYLFFRRFHQQSSSWDRFNLAHQRAYYDPEHRTLFRGHGWRRYVHLLSAVTRAPITRGDRIRLRRYLLGKMWEQRKRLLHEAVAVTAAPLTAVRRRWSATS